MAEPILSKEAYMQDHMSLPDPAHSSGESWTGQDDARRVSPQGVVIGALIGLASGLALGYLALLGASVFRLSGSEQGFGDGWFVPVLLACTVLGVVYYGREE